MGFEYGIVQGPLGPDISGPDLVAAVANAGGLGLLRSPDWVFFLFILLLDLETFCFDRLLSNKSTTSLIIAGIFLWSTYWLVGKS